MTVKDLKKELEERGLATDGLKAVLVARLEEFEASKVDEAPQDDAPGECAPLLLRPESRPRGADVFHTLSILTPPLPHYSGRRGHGGYRRGGDRGSACRN